MQLLLRRGRRPGLFHKVIWGLEVRAHLSDEERSNLAASGLAGHRLYQRLDMTQPGRGFLGVLFRFGFGAVNLSICARDLIDGRRLESPDLAEILAIEDQIRGGAQTLAQLLEAAAGFEGDEVWDL